MTIITLPAVRKRGFDLPVYYKTSELTIDAGGTRTTRVDATRLTRSGETRTYRRYATLSAKQILQSKKRIFTLPMVVIND